MKYIFSLLGGLVFVLCSTATAHAHLPGQQPYFLINGKYSDLYPVQSMFPGIELPQDIALEPYLVGEKISFEIDKEKLKQVVPEEIIQQTTFIWKFGDGAEADGLKNTHAYKKMGTYVLEIFATYEENGELVQPALIQSTLLHIVPDKNYQLPKPVIKINGKEENKNPSKNVFELNFKKEITFDATASRAPSGKIVSYLWSFTDGKTSKNAVVKHHYAEKEDFVNPALRITDNNGFYADAYVGIRNNPKMVEVVEQKKNDKEQYLVYALALPVILILAGFLLWLFKRH